MAMFNVSNHTSQKWSPAQLEAARSLGVEVVDIQFPAVPSSASKAEVQEMARALAAQIPDDASAVMIQGEMTLTFETVKQLQARGVTCLAACSERRTVEKQQADGSTIKTAVFEFVQFREY